MKRGRALPSWRRILGGWFWVWWATLTGWRWVLDVVVAGVLGMLLLAAVSLLTGMDR